MSEIKIITKYHPDFISQELVSITDDLHETLMKDILNLKEHGVRQALIKLGWTPPKDNK